MNKNSDFYFDNYQGFGKQFVQKLRFFILDSIPNCKEEIKYSATFYIKDKKTICYLIPKKDKIVIGFLKGKLLDSFFPNYLVGNQKIVRHFEVKDCNDETLLNLGMILDKAIELTFINKTEPKSKKHK